MDENRAINAIKGAKDYGNPQNDKYEMAAVAIVQDIIWSSISTKSWHQLSYEEQEETIAVWAEILRMLI